MVSEPTCSLGSVLFDFHANDQVDPPLSHVLVWGLVGLLTVLFVRCLWFRKTALRRAFEADASVDDQAPLVAGNRFLTGRVEFAEGSDHAVKVLVRQEGTETKTKNGYTHAWKESKRKTRSTPFYVLRTNGERVRVEPGTKVLLVDTPDKMIWKAKAKRTRIAALTPGEQVIVEGQLERCHDPELRANGDYRSSGQGWVMRPAPGERMHLSAEKLGDRHRKRAKATKRTAIQLACVFGFVNLLFVNYHGNFFLGQDTCGEVTLADTYATTDSKGRISHHYRLHLRVDAPDKPTMARNLDEDDWNQVKKDAIVAFRDVPAWRAAADPGWGSSVNGLGFVFAAIAAFIGFGLYASAIDYRRWYEGRLDDTGSGQLPEPPGASVTSSHADEDVDG